MKKTFEKTLAVLAALLMLCLVLLFQVSALNAEIPAIPEAAHNEAAFSPKAAIPGDYDGSGIVNVQDAILTLRAAMGLITPTEENFAAADIDGNNQITVTDAITILRMAMGLIQPPTEPKLVYFAADEIYFFSNEDSTVTFTVDAIYTTQIDLYTGSSAVGTMHDDGENGDEAANDGTYTYVLTVNFPCGMVEYYAKSGEVCSNSETLEFFDKPTEEQIDMGQEIEADMQAINAEFANEDGSIPAEAVDAAISEAADYAETLLAEGQISEYEVTDSSVVYTLNFGLTMVFSPWVEGTYSGSESNVSLTIYTFQPLYDWVQSFNHNISLPNGIVNEADLIPTAANALADKFSNCHYSSSTAVQNGSISFSDIKGIGANQIVLWQGHGSWAGEKIHSVLLTNRPFDWTAWYWNPVYFADCVAKRIIYTGGHESISSKYIKHYCGNMNNTYIYLGPCESGHDNVLAQSFLNKGATAVIGNTHSIKCTYGDLMQYTVTELLSEINPNTQNYYTLGEALTKAKSIYGVNDAYYYNGDGAEPTLFGGTTAQNYRIKNAEPGDIPPPAQEPEPPAPGSQIGFYFETEPITDGWTWEDHDGDHKCWIWNVSKPNEIIEGFMFSASYISNVVLNPDNWLISPVVPGGGSVSFKLAGTDPLYTSEFIGIYVLSDNGCSNELGCFEATETIQDITVDLSQFEGQNIEIIFRHYNAIYQNCETDVLLAAIDDVVVTVGGEAPLPHETYYLEDMPFIDWDRYTGNEGDSFIEKIGRRNSPNGIDGTHYDHGLECWVARWNYTNEISWVWKEWDISNYTGQFCAELNISSNCYNRTSYNTKLQIIGDEQILYEIDMVPSLTYPIDICVDVSHVTNLRISLHDNSSARGGTSFLLGNAAIIGSMQEPAPTIPPNIPADAVEFNGHYYYLYENANGAIANTWEDALAYCQNLGGYLATITSQEENDFLFNYMKGNSINTAYFGFTDRETEGVWKWCNGESVSYTNWHNGEPNGESHGEDYGEFYYKFNDGTWNDGDFGSRTINDIKAFICEWGAYTQES